MRDALGNGYDIRSSFAVVPERSGAVLIGLGTIGLFGLGRFSRRHARNLRPAGESAAWLAAPGGRGA